jgi:hypothetical protein
MVSLLRALTLGWRHIEQGLFGKVGNVKFHCKLRGGINRDYSFKARRYVMPNIIAKIET